MNRCSACGEEIEAGFDACWNCGATIAQPTPPVLALDTTPALGSDMEVGETRDALPDDDPEWLPEWQSVTLTTAPSLEGYRVTKTLDIITTECAVGTNIIGDILASATDILGGRSSTWQHVLRTARKSCLLELRKEAYELGANAVIAVDIDYSAIGGRGTSIQIVVASGTAVIVSPLSADELEVGNAIGRTRRA
jgi:uncharacterized protein YbjQ (UPF0145 family)